MHRALAFSSPLVLLLCSCNLVVGSGTIVSESRELTSFSKVAVSDALGAVISQGPTSVTVTTDDNVLEFVETKVEDGVLEIGVRDRSAVQPSKRIEVRISTPALESVGASGASKIVARAEPCASFAVEASGASQVEVTALSASKVSASASGASALVLAGVVESVSLDLSGASTACLAGLSSASASVALSGASSATIVATASVSGDLSGASSLEVQGEPGQRDVGTSGGSDVDYR